MEKPHCRRDQRRHHICTFSVVGYFGHLVFRNQAAVAMRLATRLASAKFALLSRSSATSRATDDEYLFWAGFFLHGQEIMPQIRFAGMVTFEQF